MAFIVFPQVAELSIFLAVAAIGHFALCVFSHNWWYGQPLPRRGTDLIQVIHGIALFGLPILFWHFGGYESLTGFEPPYFTWSTFLLVAYLVVCCLATMIALPIITFRRLLRPIPKALIRDHSNLVDVAAELDHTPAGTAKARLLSKLPGNQVFKVDFAERTLRLPRLHPAWHDVTILHISDLHFCGSPDRSFYRYVLDRCAAWDPDILAVTGDYVDSDEHRRWIVPMLRRLRWREAAFAILGNHDQWYEPPKIRRRLERLGMYVLGNSWTEITLHGQPMVVIGNEGPWYKPPTGSIGAPRERFRLCLSHTPDNIPWARREGIDLMLCGHVHGGQIRVPVIGSIIVPSRYGRRYDCGTFAEGPTVMHVSRGLGAEQPLRFNCAPEVTLIRLQREAF